MTAGVPTAWKVYAFVIEGLGAPRLGHAPTPAIDRLVRDGTEYLSLSPADPARDGACLATLLGGCPSPRRTVWERCRRRSSESLLAALERGGRRGCVADSVEEARGAVERINPDFLAVRFPSTATLSGGRLTATDRRLGDLLALLGERGCLDRATVFLLGDHPRGGVPGPSLPLAVWGEGAVPGGESREPRSVLELAPTVAALLGVDAPAGSHGRPLVPAIDPAVDLSHAAAASSAAPTAPAST